MHPLIPGSRMHADSTSTIPAPAEAPLLYGPRYARLGLAIHPVGTDKAPLTPHGFHDASRDLEQIKRWVRQFPNAGLGARTGDEIAPGSRVLAADRDDRNGGTFEGLELPATWRTITPNGEHLWFSYPAGLHITCDNAGRLGRGIDLKAVGGYLVLPPSLHPSGKRYRWAPGCAPWECPLAPAPAWLLERAVTRKATERAPLTGREWVALLESLAEGNRDVGLTRIGGLFFRSLPPALAAELLHAINHGYCMPPLGSAQVEKICESLARRELARWSR
jgi:hypothetical protein